MLLVTFQSVQASSHNESERHGSNVAKTDEEDAKVKKDSIYASTLCAIFTDRYQSGRQEIAFTREDVMRRSEGRIKNIGDLVYSFRYRSKMPRQIAETVKEPEGWIIVPRGTARYALVIHPRGGRIA